MRHVGASLVAVAALAGCQSTFYSMTGDIMSAYAVDHMLPYMMGSGDVGMACETGVSMGAFLRSFGRVTDDPTEAGLVTMMSAGMCAEGEAWEAELAQLRAMHAQDGGEAQDARIREKRAHLVAAQRFHAAFDLAQQAYGEVGAGCPELEPEAELLYLLGLSSGLLAIVHDRGADGLAEVPMGIPLAVARGAECLDAARWWGAPDALRAALWASVPGAAPEGSDPWAMMATAASQGEAAGVRLARAFQIQVAASSGKEAILREGIAAHAASLEKTTADPAWRMLDRYATLMIQHESDKLWTQHSGHRTPVGMFGTLEVEQPEPVDESLLDDFDDLEEEREEEASVEKEAAPQ